MKIMKKALALFIALIMVIGVVPAYADGLDNGMTFNLSAVVSSDNKGTSPITSASAGDTFYLIVNFSGNPTDAASTVVGYTVLFGYNPDKVTIDSKLNGLTAPTFNPEFADGVFLATWGSLDGIINDDSEIQESGQLFRVKAIAKTDLVEDDLAKIKPVTTATGPSGTQDTAFKDSNKDAFTLNWVPTLQEEVIPDPITIQASDFTVSLADQTWTGSQITPAVTSTKIPESVYTVSYGANTDLGKGTITITASGFEGKQEYNGTVTLEFNIVEKAIAEGDFTFDVANKTYTGSAIEPAVTSTLTSADYDVAYTDNTNVGTATITVTGTGNYTGTITESFTIVAKDISDSDFEFDLADKEYTGKEIKPEVKSTLIEGIDYEVKYSSNIEVGTATLVVNAKGNYTGSILKNFNIVPRAIKEFDFKFDLDNKVFTGEEIKPAVTPLTGLVEGTDYDVAYANNVQKGKATITVTGKGNYTSSVEMTFFIVAKAISDADFTFDLADKAYTGEEIKPAVTSTLADSDYDVAYTNNVQKGTATITVTGKGNYSGEIVKTFNIVTRAITEADFIFDLINKVYTGSEIKPDVTSTLIAGTDYEVKYENNIEVGTATITVTGKEPNCAGEIKKEFEIVAKTITEADFEFDLDNKEYTSNEIEPEVTPLTGLVADTDYEVTYTENVNVGTATITVVGKDNYAGRIVKTFDITPRTLKDGDFTFDLADKVYTGEAIEPEVTSTLADADFEVVYTDNVNAGTATITVTGKAPNCTGTIVKTFNILPRPISDDDFKFDLVNKVYTGEEIKPAVESELAEGTDYEVTYADNTEKGTATITVTGKAPNCTGEIVKTFKIVAEAIEEGDFTIDDADKVYTGSAIEPVVTSTLASTDYEVWYENNVEVGTATIIINGIGDDYGGTIEKTFNITQKAITDADFTLDPTSYVYTGSEIKPDVTSALAAGKDYEVTYTNNVEVGTATITIKGIGNYSGEVAKTFDITKKTISDADFTVDLSDRVYTGSEIKPKVISTIVEGTDYEVAYTDNVNVGTATITVTAKGNNSTGTATFNFKIVARVITEADFTADLSDKVYTGEEIKPEVTSTLADGDYVVTYKNNVEVGTATITIEGKGPNCKGWVELTFNIVEKYAPSVGGGGGGGSATYPIAVPEAEGGKVSASHNTAKAGHTVTVTVTPDEGYVLSEVKVVDKSGKEIAVTKDGENYKFVMPNSTVEVKAIFTNGEEGDGFTDVKPDAYYYDAVNWAVDAGITNGMSSNMFGSGFDCTRAQMVTFLWRAAGCPKPMTTESDFVDIVKGSYYYDAVLWAEENGITIGTSATTFSPDDNVTRGQTVTFFWRMENKPTAEVNVEFTDVAADAYYYDAVAWAVEEEITNGVSATEFAPNDMCKREQIVTFLYRFFVK